MSHLRECEIATLRPTQITVGMREVHDKCEELERLGHHALREHLEQHPIPAVIGHHHRLFITDHHHLGRALWQAHIASAFFWIEADLSGLPPDAFWTEMEAKHWVHPIDEHGRRRQIDVLPKHIEGLIDDPYRSLAGYVRNAGGFVKTPTAFAEFLWADFFRKRIRIGPHRADFDRAVAEAMQMVHGAEARTLPGYLPARTD
jgi:hypothetical protein